MARLVATTILLTLLNPSTLALPQQRGRFLGRPFARPNNDPHANHVSSFPEDERRVDLRAVVFGSGRGRSTEVVETTYTTFYTTVDGPPSMGLGTEGGSFATTGEGLVSVVGPSTAVGVSVTVTSGPPIQQTRPTSSVSAPASLLLASPSQRTSTVPLSSAAVSLLQRTLLTTTPSNSTRPTSSSISVPLIASLGLTTPIGRNSTSTAAADSNSSLALNTTILSLPPSFPTTVPSLLNATTSVFSAANLTTLTSSTASSTSKILASRATSPSSSTPSATTTSSTSDPLDVYRPYTGDGTLAAGWPSEDDWVTFTHMFTANTPNMLASCAQWGVPLNSDAEMAVLHEQILSIGDATGVDPRFILAIILQESTGCVRVITTAYSHANPGLMQSFNGTGSCNTDAAVQTPCPASEIRQQILDGTNGTAWGPGLVQDLAEQGRQDVSRWYRTARLYNGGAIVDGDLSKPCCTASYASDVANRLTGWVNAARVFTAA